MNSNTLEGARRRVGPVVLAAALLIGGANIGAYAATGRPLILGHTNTSSKTTVLVHHGSGAALKLQSGKSSPSLKVSSGKVVKHLNADRVDGVSAASLANTALTYLLPTGQAGASVTYTFPGLPGGVFEASFYVNRTLRASGRTAPQLACSLFGTNTGQGQLTTLTPAGTHATGSATGTLRVDGTAKLTCTVHAGTLVSSNLPAASGITFLKVDRSAYGVAGAAKVSRR